MARAALAVVPDVPRGTSIEELPVDLVDVGPNVRVNVEAIDELAASIAAHGVLQPIKVRPAGDRWTVVWGQRRLLAARQAGLERIPAIVDAGDRPAAETSIEQLVENLHRADLNPIDRARAMRDVVAAGMSQADLARELGIAPSTVANDVGLLEAPKPILELVEKGELTPSHAKAMKGLAPKTQVALARDVVRGGLSAHATEQEVQERKRRADVERENREREANAQAVAQEQLAASIVTETAKKKVPADALIVVDQGYDSSNGVGRLVALIRAAGFPNVRASKGWREIDARPAGGVCDCTAWKATEHHQYNYSERVDGYYRQTYRAAFTKGCIEPKHRQAKADVDETKRKAGYATQEKVQAYVKRMTGAWAVPEARAISIDRLLAETVLWGLLSYRLPEWSVAHGGKRNTAWQTIHALPDDELAAELAKAIADDFRDEAGYHVDWPGLAAELGIEVPE